VVFLAAPGLFKKDGEFARFGPRPNPDAQPAPVADADVEGVADHAARPAGTEEPKSQTQYDFYTLLPGKEVQMTDAELAASARAEEARRAKAALEGRSPIPVAAQAASPSAASAQQTATAGIPAALPETGAAPARSPAPAAVAQATPDPQPAAPATAAHQTAAAPKPAAAKAEPAEADARYILQAGAFGASGDAEMVKARIAMLGLSARVESAQAGGKTVYRVRMGPYGSASELSEAKQKLGASGLPAVAIRMQ
jgi:cell division protein FtsN